jgi:N-acetylglutamate synthase-like GNAT family acetyltransferase
MNPADLEVWRKVRDRMLAEMNMQWAREMMPGTTDQIRIMAMHKARVEALDMDRALRLESIEWLRERGFSRGTGDTLPPPGMLPGEETP